MNVNSAQKANELKSELKVRYLWSMLDRKQLKCVSHVSVSVHRRQGVTLIVMCSTSSTRLFPLRILLPDVSHALVGAEDAMSGLLPPQNLDPHR